MEYSRTLRNNNVIYSGTRNTYNQQTTSDFSIRFVFSGNERYNIGKRQLSIHSDSFLILNKGTHYTSTVESAIPVQSFGISFDDKFLQDFRNSWQLKDEALLSLNKNPFVNRYEHEFDETIYPFKGDLFFNVNHLKHHLDRGLQDELLINEYLHHCLINYFQIFNEEIFQKAQRLNFLSRSTKIEILRRLNLAKEYLYSNYNQNISLDELAEYACLSVTHLLRTFRQAFYQTPHQFLVQIRLQRAKDLLKTTDYPVNEIVNMVGFDCPSSFIRLFKDRFQTTPLKYRQGFSITIM
jgi:AraC family transcriptional regulator